jgi:preprotein translocase subunit SecE
MRNEPVVAIAVEAPEAPVAIEWPTRREATRAVAAVACFVGVPALAAVGAVVALFALSAAVLVAPLVAAALTWAAWHCNRAPSGGAGAKTSEVSGPMRAPPGRPP